MKKLAILLGLFFNTASHAQKVDSIYFNLYTDSLKKGVFNYINVDGLLSTGAYIPLMANELNFSSSCGTWQGNNLILDTSVKLDRVTITASLKSRPQISKTVIVYLKKNNTEEVLKSEKEIIEGYRKHKKRQIQE